MNRAALVIALFALACAAGARGQDTRIPEAAALPRYEIEVVVFRNLDQRGHTPELPMPGSAIAADAGTASLGPDPVVEAAYPPLDLQSLRLSGIVSRMRRGSVYQPIFHGGWVQPAGRQTQAVPTRLPPEAQRAGIQGSITLYRERYLHALVDVALGSTSDGDSGLHRIHQGRRLRGESVHYFDHPGFGVILAARPLASEPPGAGDAFPETSDDPRD